MTYPNPQVAMLLNAEFACLKCNIREKLPQILLSFGKIQWTPTFAIIDSAKNQVRRIVGFLPPGEFQAELRLSLALIDLIHTRNKEALLRFDHIIQQYPKASVAPEAVFWKGVAAYWIAGRNRDILKEHWKQLSTDFPESTWRDRAAVFPGWEPHKP